MSTPLAIEVNHLVKKFGVATAVNDISFTVNSGEIFAFLGPNGAGKTTTIKMLTTLLLPTSGELKINGLSVTHDMRSVRKSFGIVFQDQSLDEELTAGENLHFHAMLYNVPRDIATKRIETLLGLVGLWEKRNNLVKTFSGGMRRRLEIARSLIHHPSVLFLDEPTVGLDPQTRTQLWEYIHTLNEKENISVFFTTHYMEEAEKYAGSIAIIDNGTIIASGTAIELEKQTKTATLEDAFLALTGKTIREEKGEGSTRFRHMHGGGRR